MCIVTKDSSLETEKISKYEWIALKVFIGGNCPKSKATKWPKISYHTADSAANSAANRAPNSAAKSTG